MGAATGPGVGRSVKAVGGVSVPAVKPTGERKHYICECTEGFKDDGTTCVPHDCGALVDESGEWTGSTRWGGEYTLICEEGAFVWGGYLTEITISCGNKGRWLSHPRCINPSLELEEEDFCGTAIPTPPPFDLPRCSLEWRPANQTVLHVRKHCHDRLSFAAPPLHC